MKIETRQAKKIENTEVLSLEEAIAYHLGNNFCVPLPKQYIQPLVPICIEAIRAVNDHNLTADISLPNGVVAVNREGKESSTAYAYEIVANYKLFQWLNSEWF